MPIKLATQQQLRQYYASNTMVSARIEGITLTEWFQKNLTDYVTGKKSIAQLIEETKQRYATHPLK